MLDCFALLFVFLILCHSHLEELNKSTTEVDSEQYQVALNPDANDSRRFDSDAGPFAQSPSDTRYISVELEVSPVTHQMES